MGSSPTQHKDKSKLLKYLATMFCDSTLATVSLVVADSYGNNKPLPNYAEVADPL